MVVHCIIITRETKSRQTHPTPNSNSFPVNVIFRRPETTAQDGHNKRRINFRSKVAGAREIMNPPRRIDLVSYFPEPKVSLDRVAQCAPFVPRAASIDNDNDVLQAAREIRVPADVERSAHGL